MDQNPEKGPRGWSARLWTVVAVLLTAGLALSLIAMLYALVKGLLHRFKG